jgi:hypothetical protein
MVYDTYCTTIVNGVYKPTYNWGPAMENAHGNRYITCKWVIFPSYVKLPDGKL